MIFSDSLRKYCLFAGLIFSSTCFGQTAFFEVDSTPYDKQMAKVQPTLSAAAGYTLEGISLALVNEWMSELRAMPYRYSSQWKTPLEVEAEKAGDCKGKAMALYDMLQLNGATNVRFVIGKRRADALRTHAWVEWETKTGAYLLDPTFNWTIAREVHDSTRYIPFYAYEGGHKYQATTYISTWHRWVPLAPAAPSQGVSSTIHLGRDEHTFTCRPGLQNPWGAGNSRFAPQSVVDLRPLLY